ncbi:L-amino acid N-acyltransferase YncA [Pilibacter termitis]|uniref:L-amino acid N-acyltransferase YncA n=1 Tax=Pilibacter termitis TaxID=263852 RepID=A0A1T4Q4C4_9ENTE|nr:GNAT family N-acetyltransferase [Pilibacter termitis]SJZ98603.1 L-amino acid N-acyltransferase YncA [Pilibacter termitis]
MKIRKATQKDMKTILQIFSDARTFLHEQEIPQWQGEYPNKLDVLKDIEQNFAYVLTDDEQVIGYAALQQTPDANYRTISQGSWKNNNDNYATIHRLSTLSSVRQKGVGKLFFSLLLYEAKRLGFKEVRVDTHEKNKIMQKVIAALAFEKRGIVTVEDGSPRIAYQKFFD